MRLPALRSTKSSTCTPRSTSPPARSAQRDRGAGVTSFYVTKWANMPALLVETGFMSNPTEGAWIANAAWRTRYVNGIATGISRWLATDPLHPLYGRVSSATLASTAASASRSNSCQSSASGCCR